MILPSRSASWWPGLPLTRGATEAVPRAVRSISPPYRPVTVVRCECLRCGAHTITERCYSIGGHCGTCGSYDLRPVKDTSGHEIGPGD